jgi:hypothetical protein
MQKSTSYLSLIVGLPPQLKYKTRITTPSLKLSFKVKVTIIFYNKIIEIL